MIVASLLDGVANDVAHLNVGVGRDLADDERQSGGDGGLAGDPAERILRHDGVEDRVRDLVGDLVRVAFGDRLRGKEMVAAGYPPPHSQPPRDSASAGGGGSTGAWVAAHVSAA